MSVIEDFKRFISRGNVIDLATGVILGSAFGKVVSALVDRVMMPPLGLLIGGVDFSRLRIVLKPASPGEQEVAVYLGEFVQAGVNFLIIASAIFVLIKVVKMIHIRSEQINAGLPPPPPPEDILLLREIRDSLKKP